MEKLQRKYTRDKLYKKFKSTKLHVDEEMVRNTVQNLIRKKKKAYFDEKLKEITANPKKLKKTLKQLGQPEKRLPCTDVCLKVEDLKFDPFTISELFKKFYSNLANDLVHKLPVASKKFDIEAVKDYYNDMFELSHNKLNFQTVQPNTISNLLKSCNVNKAAGIDNVSGRFLKDGADVLGIPITQICNLSIKLSHFPKDCKVAKLKPLYKKGTKTDPKNFRPISLLPIVSKIFEKVIHEQTMEYLTDNNILYKYQSGFRKNHSTDTSLSYLTNKIMTGFDSGLLTGMILIDLQKAFDTINHDILLKKMASLGFSNHSIKWFQSYLSDRSFRVNIKNKYSSTAKIECGVPQGSMLGPFLLFLLFINDMKQVVDCDLFLYADESCLVYQHDVNDVSKIEQNLNKNF